MFAALVAQLAVTWASPGGGILIAFAAILHGCRLVRRYLLVLAGGPDRGPNTRGWVVDGEADRLVLRWCNLRIDVGDPNAVTGSFDDPAGVPCVLPAAVGCCSGSEAACRCGFL